MEIKQACEYVKSNGGFYGSLKLGTKANEAYKTIEKALCDGYTLCKVDETKCTKANCPIQYDVINPDCDLKNCPYRTEGRYQNECFDKKYGRITERLLP